jgi:hypothetical protein
VVLSPSSSPVATRDGSHPPIPFSGLSDFKKMPVVVSPRRVAQGWLSGGESSAVPGVASSVDAVDVDAFLPHRLDESKATVAATHSLPIARLATSPSVSKSRNYRDLVVPNADASTTKSLRESFEGIANGEDELFSFDEDGLSTGAGAGLGAPAFDEDDEPVSGLGIGLARGNGMSREVVGGEKGIGSDTGNVDDGNHGERVDVEAEMPIPSLHVGSLPIEIKWPGRSGRVRG